MTPLALRTVAPIDPATTDAKLIGIWLKRFESPHTRRGYQRYVSGLLAATGKGVRQTTLEDVQTFLEGIGGPSVRAAAVRAIKSLFRFAHTLGLLTFNVAGAVRLPNVREQLAKRILTEGQTENLLAAAEESPRDHALLRLLYNGGLRVSEAVALRWSDLLPDRASGIVTVAGKGGKTRQVRLSKGTWVELQSLRGEGDVEGFIFAGSWRRDDSGKRAEHLDSSAVLRIVRKAAKAAGIKGHVSPHFLRHSHASHAIERGCDLAVVRDSLGHSSLATTSRYVHARPDRSSGDYLAV